MVNSYKRLSKWKVSKKPAPEKSLITVCDEFGERSVEVRFPDPSANIYAVISLILRAGLEGIDEKAEFEKASFKGLPGNLKDALLLAHDSEFVKEVLGEEFTQTYVNQKLAEWDEYLNKVSDWEIEKYLLKV